MSGAGTCSLIPKNTRLSSSLQASAARSLITQPLGKPSAFAGSRTTGADAAAPSFSAAADVRERDEDVVLLAHLLDVAPLEHGEGRAVVVPGEAAVALGVVVERGDAPVARVEDEDAVAVLDGGIHGEGEKLAGPVERDVATLPSS